MTEKNNNLMYIGIAIIFIIIAIFIWFITKKKEEEEEEDLEQDSPFEEDHPGYTGAVWVEEYKEHDIWYWAGKPNPYIAVTTIRQWFETITQARNRISDHVGY